MSVCVCEVCTIHCLRSKSPIKFEVLFVFRLSAGFTLVRTSPPYCVHTLSGHLHLVSLTLVRTSAPPRVHTCPDISASSRSHLSGHLRRVVLALVREVSFPCISTPPKLHCEMSLKLFRLHTLSASKTCHLHTRLAFEIHSKSSLSSLWAFHQYVDQMPWINTPVCNMGYYLGCGDVIQFSEKQS